MGKIYSHTCYSAAQIIVGISLQATLPMATRSASWDTGPAKKHVHSKITCIS